MTRALKAYTTLLVLIAFGINAAARVPPGFSSQTGSPQSQDSAVGPRLEPVGSFPPEPVLAQVTPSVAQVLERADNLRKKGDYPAALRTRAEGLELARHSNPVDEGFALRGKALDLIAQKKYDEALTAALEAVDAFARAGDTVGEVETLTRFASLMQYGELDRQRSDELLTRSLKIGQAETLRPGRMYRVLRGTGAMLRENSLSWSKTFFTGALDIAGKYPEAVEETGLSSYDLANLAYQTGDFAEAQNRLRQNLTLWTKLRENAVAHLADMNRQSQQANQKDLLLIEGYRNQIANLEASRGYYGGQLARTYTKLGEIARAQGDSTTAENSFDTAIKILTGERLDPLLTSQAYRNSGMLKLEEGELLSAGDDLNAALTFAIQGRSVVETVQAEIALGMLAVEQHNYSSAENFLQVARGNVDLERADRLAWAANNLALGETFARMGDSRLAASYLPTALAVYQQYEMPLQIAYVKLISGTFEVDRSLEQATKDLTDTRETLNKLAPKSVMMARVLNSVAFNLGHQDHDAEMEPLLIEAKEILEKSAPKSVTLPVIEHNLMNSRRTAGKLVEAEKLAFQSWDHMRKLAPEFTGEEAGESYSSMFTNYGAGLAWLQIQLKKNDAAFLTLERTRARGLFQLLAQRKDVDNKQWLAHKTALSDRYRAESDFAQAANASIVAGRTLTSLKNGKAGPVAISEAETLLKERQQEGFDAAESLAMATARADTVWRNLLDNTSGVEAPLDLPKLQKSLPPGTVYLMYSRDRDGLMVLALRAGSSEVVAETLDVKGLGLGVLASNFRDAFDSEPSEKDLASINTQGETLFKYLFPGKIRALALNAEHLVISPDGILWNVPFAALVSGRNANQEPQYLGLLKPITYSQSLSLYLRATQEPSNLKPGQKPVALVIGDPLFDLREAGGTNTSASEDKRETVWAALRSRNSPPPPLKYSREEAKSVGCLFGATPLLGRDANEASLRKDIESADVIHLASHSVTRAAMPMSSGILLSPPSMDPPAGEMDNDGVLQAWEIFSQLRLRAELVVLSACDTALGKTVRGEGIVGLARAFQYAGARSLVASQWEVGDRSTSALMLAFYEALGAGKQKDEALRLAMIKVAAAKATGHPHYWAAFTLTGASNNLNLRGASLTGCQ
ncbi:MAG TPA: CHAT domain-containing protein [Pyrinomonadaceae bacterium]|jgi:CHAT domain-containing protein/tetratricopeptide (TPR) repeat protein|nr:CHAT domain-containing protein [Pyrinomonadaceae bacterium]